MYLLLIQIFEWIAENPEGTETNVTGEGGVVVSPNYPSFYPNTFNHTWTITVAPSSVIELTVTNFDTEINDVLQV